MKVLLVTPPYHCGVVESAGRWLPLGLLYLAEAVRRAGHEVEVYDAMTLFHAPEEVEAHIAARAPEVVAVTMVTPTAVAAVEVLAGAKRRLPGVITVAGGVHATFMAKDLLLATGSPVDYCVIGEGEATLPDLLACLAAGADPARVRGVACRQDGAVAYGPPRAVTPDLEAVAPAWDLVNWNDYTYFPFPGSRLAIVSSSRGCSFACSFCSQTKFWDRGWRGRRPEAVADELEMLRDRHGVDVVLFSDEYPTPDRDRWTRLMDLALERKLGMKFLMETRVEDIVRDADLLPRWREAGVIHVYVGVESTEQGTLDRFNKHLRVEQSREALALLNAAGMVSETSFVLGMPEDTPETIRNTLALAHDYAPDFAHFLLIAPWPYAELYPQLKP